MKRLLVVSAAIAMLLALVGVPPAGGAHGTDGNVCVAFDPGGLDDAGFNGNVADAVAQAARRLHVDFELGVSDDLADIAATIDDFVTSGDCDLIIGVGFLVGIEMEPFVAANPGQRFAIIDYAFFGGPYPNAAEVLFRVDQSSFLAGYLAAGISETGKVGVYGGIPIPPVTQFMDGYALGVEHYNAVHGTSVEVLGWDVDTQTGLFTFTFVDPAAGQAATALLYDDGADTVFAVAGFTGQGSLDEAALRVAAGEQVRVIEPDVDWYDIDGDPARVLLTSVLKGTGVAAYHQIAALVSGTWTPGEVWEDLATGGTDIAEFHKLNNQVPGHLRNDLKGLRAGIIDGSIPTLP